MTANLMQGWNSSLQSMKQLDALLFIIMATLMLFSNVPDGDSPGLPSAILTCMQHSNPRFLAQQRLEDLGI